MFELHDYPEIGPDDALVISQRVLSQGSYNARYELMPTWKGLISIPLLLEKAMPNIQYLIGTACNQDEVYEVIQKFHYDLCKAILWAGYYASCGTVEESTYIYAHTGRNDGFIVETQFSNGSGGDFYVRIDYDNDGHAFIQTFQGVEHV